MKEHILRKMINDLTKIAHDFHDHDSLRERVKARVMDGLNDDVEWYRTLAIYQSKDAKS